MSTPRVVVRAVVALIGAGITIANLRAVNVNLVAFTVAIPLAGVVLATVATTAALTLRWNAARVATERERIRRRRETDTLLRRPSFSTVQH